MSDAMEMLDRLRAHGLRGIDRCRLTQNRAVMVSYRGPRISVHRGFVDAPPGILRAVVAFVNGRGERRREARRAILAYPVQCPPPSRRRERTHPGDAVTVARLLEAHALLNRRHFQGGLREIEIRVSRRLRRRLGYYRLPYGEDAPEIVISRYHLRRHGWRATVETLLHEMVHQWQFEQGLPVDHGARFRSKAREVGIEPTATRASRGLLRAARDFLSAARHEMFAACDDH
jgi:hypothetical protein